jgi:uncharacterized membrane protein
MSRFKYKLTFIKTLSWRLLSVFITVLLVYLITGEHGFKILSIIAVTDFIIKFFVFMLHERIWYDIFKKTKRNAMFETQNLQGFEKD